MKVMAVLQLEFTAEISLVSSPDPLELHHRKQVGRMLNRELSGACFAFSAATACFLEVWIGMGMSTLCPSGGRWDVEHAELMGAPVGIGIFFFSFLCKVSSETTAPSDRPMTSKSMRLPTVPARQLCSSRRSFCQGKQLESLRPPLPHHYRHTWHSDAFVNGRERVKGGIWVLYKSAHSTFINAHIYI